MSITVELTSQEIDQLKQITRLNSDSEAVSKAVREFLRLRRLCELKSVSGRVEFEDNWQALETFEDNWQALETLELGETQFPQ